MLTQELSSGARWTFLGQVGVVAFGFALTVLVARLVDPTTTGTYLSTVAIVGLATLVSQMGRTTILTRAIAVSSNRNLDPLPLIKQILSIGILVSILVGAVAGVLLSIMATQFDVNAVFVVALATLIAVWTAGRTAEALLAASHRGFGHFAKAAMTNRFVALLTTAGVFTTFWVLRMEPSLWVLFIVSVASAVAVGLMSYLVLVRGRSQEVDRQETAPASLLKGAGDVWFASVVGYATRNSGIWILIFLATQDEVALFGVAQRLVLPILLPLTIVNGFIGPIIATMADRSDLRDLEGVLRFAAAASSAAALVVAAFVVAAGPFLLRWAFGEFYEQSYSITLILAAGVLGNVLSGSPGVALVMTGHQRQFSVASAFYGGLSLITGAVAYAAFGLLGLATAISIVTAAQFLTMTALVHRKTGMIILAEPRPARIRDSWRTMRSVKGVTSRSSDRQA